MTFAKSQHAAVQTKALEAMGNLFARSPRFMTTVPAKGCIRSGLCLRRVPSWYGWRSLCERTALAHTNVNVRRRILDTLRDLLDSEDAVIAVRQAKTENVAVEVCIGAVNEVLRLFLTRCLSWCCCQARVMGDVDPDSSLMTGVIQMHAQHVIKLVRHVVRLHSDTAALTSVRVVEHRPRIHRRTSEPVRCCYLMLCCDTAWQCQPCASTLSSVC